MKYKKLLKNLTLNEKMKLLIGADQFTTESLNGKIKKLIMSDASNGLRLKPDGSIYKNAIAFPSLSVVANTWNRELAELQGESIADECIDNGVDVLLGPGINIKRTPLNGRNFEYLSEDPYLTSELAKPFISGVQKKGIGACMKHYAVNSREFDRFYQSSDVPNRALYEIYTRAFKNTVDAKPWMVMCSYNPVNGVFASENIKLLKKMLRDEYGFDGLIVSDWSAVHNRWKALKATLDLEMPYRENAYEELKNAYEKGFITEKEIDNSVANFLELLDKTENDKKKVSYTREQRHKNAVEIAKEGFVLLKNEGNILPLKNNKNIIVIGDMAQKPNICGGGSAYVFTEYKQKNLAELLGAKLPKANVRYADKFKNDTTHSVEFMFCTKAALTEAYKADVAIVCVGNNYYGETESLDRHSIKLSPNQELLINETAKVNSNTVVLVYSGSAIDMTNWIGNVKGVVYVGFAGEGVNEALADILTGETVPSGKINETFPISLESTYVKDDMGNGFYDAYHDGVLVGYRYYDKKNIDVLFPFGYGLSYADFEYSDLTIEKYGETDYAVKFFVENTSDYDAKEISQVYIKDVFSMVERPISELKGFSKVLILAHEKKEITIKLDADSFSYYSDVYEKYYVENGVYEVCVGTSSRDIKLKGKIDIELADELQQSKI